MTAWIAWAFCLPAFSALSFAMQRHQEQAFGRVLSPSATLAWRALGVALLVVSLGVCLLSNWSVSVAIAAWIGVLSFGALCVGLMFAFAPRRLRPFAAAVFGLGVIAWAIRQGF